MTVQRSWWQSPKLRTDEEEEHDRKVSWLELFFDLVFVVVISELAGTLAHDISWSGVGKFILLFVPIWWVWMGSTYYNERFETEGLESRLFTFLQMLPVAGLAVFAHHALGSTSIGFAISYILARSIIAGLWLWGGYHEPSFRPTARRFATGAALAAVFFLASIAIPAPQRFVLWGIGALLDVLTPTFTIRHQANLPRFSTSRLPERLGLLMIIVLGEVIVGVIHGVASAEHLSLTIIMDGIFGMLLGFGLWWTYFDFVARRPPKRGIVWSLLWGYSHMPLVTSIAATGAGILNVIASHDNVLLGSVRALISCSLGIALIMMGVLELTLERSPDEPTHPFLSPVLKWGAASIAIAMGIWGGGIHPILLLSLLMGLIVIQMAYGFYTWFFGNQTTDYDE